MRAISRPRRSALYLPASNARAVEKARGLACDVVILDLEDAVAPEQKDAARDAAFAAVQAGGFGNREIVIRANAPDCEWGVQDIAMITNSGADAVLLPKVSSPQQVLAAEAAVAGAAASMQLWVMIETCASIGQLSAIAALAHHTRLAGFVMGVNDLAKEMNAQQTLERTAFLPMLSLAVCAARAHGLVILDGVCNEFRDQNAFIREAQQGREFGFDGKTLIHPDQIALCNEVFSASEQELAWAKAIIAAFALPEHHGKGVIRLDGKMVELLHLEQAKALVSTQNMLANY